MTRISDVAKHAHVSSATVSRALSGDIHVDSITRQHVIDSATELDYRLDHTARFLRRRRSDLIGLVVSTIENPFFTEVARAAEQAAGQRGYSLIICNTDENPSEEQRYLDLLDRLLAAGVILAPAPGHATHLQKFIGGRVPIVLINRTLNLMLSSVICNDEEAAYECTSLLVGQGRKRIAAITGLAGVSTTHYRRKGYRCALWDAGLQPYREVYGQATLQGGYAAAHYLMSQDDTPDAIFPFNNQMTQGAVMALLDMGLRWPDDVDVAGFGVFSTARLYRPPLTLIAQPTHQMGQSAIEMVLDHPAGSPLTTVVLNNQIIPRERWLADRMSILELSPKSLEEVTDARGNGSI